MTKYQVRYIFSDGSEDYEEELFDSEEEANEVGCYGCGCYQLGGELLNMSNPGDYSLGSTSEVDFEIIELND